MYENEKYVENNGNESPLQSYAATHLVNNDYNKLSKNSNCVNDNSNNHFYDSSAETINVNSELDELCESKNFVYKNSNEYFTDSHTKNNNANNNVHDLNVNMNIVNAQLNESYKSHVELHSDIKNCYENDSDYNFCEGRKSKRTNNSMIKYTVAGLENFGSTCYINSVLQCLTNCSPLREFLLNDKLSLCCGDTNFCMICALRRHLINVKNNPGEVIKPTEIYTNLRSIAPHFRYDRQQDAHEFLSYVIDRMWNPNSLHCLNSKQQSENKFAAPINLIFGSYVKTEITCLNCKNKSFTYNQMMDFMLDITKNVKTLDSAIYNFIRPEVLSNEYSCHCSKIKVNAKIENSISQLPKVITFQLKRFSFQNSQSIKIHSSVSYPEILNLSPFLEVPTREPMRYSLTGVIVHSGPSTNTGHY